MRDGGWATARPTVPFHAHRAPGPRAPAGPDRRHANHARARAGVAHESVGGESKATTTPTTQATMTMPQTPCNGHGRENIHLETCEADPNDLAGTTLRWLGLDGVDFGPELAAIDTFRYWMKTIPAGLTLFANPIARVTATLPCAAFVAESRRQQRRWFAELNSWLFSAERVKRHYALAHPVIRQLEFTGVMIADGKHVRPNQWPSPPGRPASESLVGRVFGLLTVTAELPGQQCRCLCRCGASVSKRKKHLIAGRTKSCGCLAAAKAKAIEGRKRESWQSSRR